MVCIDVDFLGNRVVVGAVVGDIQFTVAVDKGQITVTVESARMTRAQRNHVAMEHIVDRGRGITVYRIDVGSRRNGTGLCVTTGKHGIVNDDTRLIQTAPPGRIGILVFQHVQRISRHKLAGDIVMTVNGHGVHHLKHRFDNHLAVLGEKIASDIVVILILIIITFAMRYSIVAIASLLTNAEAAVCFLVGAVDYADITAAEHIAVTVGQSGSSTNLTTVDVYLSLTEDVARAVE